MRQTSATDIINRLRPKMNRLPVASAFLQAAQDLRIGGRGGNAQYQYTIQTENIPDLARWGPILMANMRRLPGLQDVNSDQQNGGLQEMLTFDRATAARLGQTAQSLDRSLYSAFGQQEVSVIYTQLNQYYVVLEVAPPYWQDPSGLNNIYFAPTTNSNKAGLNAVTPLTSLMHPATNTTPLQVNHTGLFPSVTVSFNLGPGYALSDATREISEMEQIRFENGSITALPFLGEHGDLNVVTKSAYLLTTGRHRLMFAADSCNIAPQMYKHVHRDVGDVDALFVGMECDGAPVSWIYGPLLTQKLERQKDHSRRLAGSNYERALAMVQQFGCKEVYVYAMGQEPWLNYVMSIKYTEKSNPIVHSNRLMETCREQGITAERLFGEKEILLS